jgi:SNF2 family DNA or RNA helicase
MIQIKKTEVGLTIQGPELLKGFVIRDFQSIGVLNVTLSDSHDIEVEVDKDADLEELVRNYIELLEEEGCEVRVDDSIKSEIHKRSTEKHEDEQELNAARAIWDGNISEEQLRSFLIHTKVQIRRNLYQKQVLASYFMAKANSANFSVPGAGKTTIVYAAYAYLKSLNVIDTLLVICPGTAVRPWFDEFESVYGYKPRVNEASVKSNAATVRLSHTYDYHILNYEKLKNGYVLQRIKQIIDKGKVFVVLDEAHRIKSKEGVWASGVLSITQNGSRKVVLTGTPMPNGYEDLYNIFKFLYPKAEVLKYGYDYLKSLSKNPNTHAADKVRESIKKYFLRIKKSDLNLPRIEEKIPKIVLPTSSERVLIQLVKSKARLSSNKLLASSIRLIQVSGNPSLLMAKLDSQEISRIDEIYGNTKSSDIINDIGTSLYELLKPGYLPSKLIAMGEDIQNVIDNGDKVVVWTLFTNSVRMIYDYLTSNGYKGGVLVGGNNKLHKEIHQDLSRDQIIDTFKNTNQYQFVVANPAAVSESISLHVNKKGEKVCSNAFYYEMSYNANHLVQSKDRIHRVGMSPDTIATYWYYQVEGTVDVVLQKKLSRKVANMLSVIEGEDIPLFANDTENMIRQVLVEYLRGGD